MKTKKIFLISVFLFLFLVPFVLGAGEITITPQDATTLDNLKCTVEGSSSNAVYQFIWRRDGDLIRKETHNGPSDILKASNYRYNKYQNLRCTVRYPNNVGGGAVVGQDTITIQNAAPIIDSHIANVTNQSDATWYTTTELDFDIYENSNLTLRIRAHDPDNDNITYAWYVNGEEEEHYVGRRWKRRFGFASSGDYEIRVVVTDIEGLTDELTWNVHVNNINRNFTDYTYNISNSEGLTYEETYVGDKIFEEGDRIILDLSAWDQDNHNTNHLEDDDTPIEYTITELDGTGFTLNTYNVETAQFIWDTTDEDAGNYTIVVEASDGQFVQTKTITFYVLNLNRAPYFITFENHYYMEEEETLNIDIDFDDLDNQNSVTNDNNTLTLTTTATYPEMTFSQNNNTHASIDWTAGIGSTGDYLIELTLCDDGEKLIAGLETTGPGTELCAYENITIHVTTDLGWIEGVIRNETDLVPLEDVNITIWNGSQRIANTFTNSTGEYSVRIPGWNNYLVRAEKQNYNSNQTENVQVIANTITQVDMTLLYNPTPIPVSDVDVYLCDGVSERTTSTTQNAEYYICIYNNGTASDTFDLSVNDLTGNTDTYMLNDSSAVFLNPGDVAGRTLYVGDTTEGEYNVTVTATSQTDVTIFDATNITTTTIVQAVGWIYGYITNESNGQPLFDATVTVLNGTNVEGTAQTDVLGFFNITVPPYNDYEVTATLAGYNSNSTSSVIVSEQHSTEASMTLSEIIIDTEAPVITIVSPANTTYFTSDVWINISATDNIGIYDVWYNWEGTNETFTGNFVEVFLEGTYTLYAYANDSAGNENSTSVTFTIDTISPNTAPWIELNLPANDSIINDFQDVDFNFTAYDNENATLVCSIYLDGTENVTIDPTSTGVDTIQTITGIDWGTHEWYVNCSDGEFTAVSDTWTFELNDTTVTPVYDVNVYLCDDNNKITTPLENATYEICVENNGTADATYDITFNNINSADFVDVNETSISVSAGDIERILLSVGDSTEGEYNVTVTATRDVDATVTDTTSIVTTIVSTCQIINSDIDGQHVECGFASDFDNIEDNSFIVDSNLTSCNIYDVTTFNNVNCTNANVTNSTMTNSDISDAEFVNVDYTNVIASAKYYYDETINCPVYGWCVYDPTVGNNTYNITGPNTIDGNSNVTNNYLEGGFNINSSNVNNSDIIDSNITDSDVDESIVDNSELNNTDADNCEIYYSEVTDSYVIDCTIDNSTVTNSTIDNSNVTDSNVTDSTINDSVIDDSVIDNSTITNSTIINSTIEDMNVTDANITDDVVYNGTVCIGDWCYNATNNTELNLSDDTQFPSVSLSASPMSGEETLDVTFMASIDGNFNTTQNVTYYWDFGDGNPVVSTESDTGTSQISHPYGQGTYEVTVRAEDFKGTYATDTITITVSSGGGSGGSGGGSGGSSSGATGYMPSELTIDFNKENPSELIVGLYDRIYFEYNGNLYSIVFQEITSRKIKLFINPINERGEVKINDRSEFNLDDEPMYDLYIWYEEYIKEDGTARLLLKLPGYKRIGEVLEPGEEPEEDTTGILKGVVDIFGSEDEDGDGKKDGVTPWGGIFISAIIVVAGLLVYFVFTRNQ